MRQGIKDTGYHPRTSDTYSAKYANPLNSLQGIWASRGADYQTVLYSHLFRAGIMLRERIHTVATGPVNVHPSLYLALELEPVPERILVHRRPIRLSLVRAQPSRSHRVPLMDDLSTGNRHYRQFLYPQDSGLEVHNSLDAVQPVLLEL